MPIKLIGSWSQLFRLAGEAGQARERFALNPTSENQQAMFEAIKAHDEYRDFCLTADEMIGLNL